MRREVSYDRGGAVAEGGCRDLYSAEPADVGVASTVLYKVTAVRTLAYCFVPVVGGEWFRCALLDDRRAPCYVTPNVKGGFTRGPAHTALPAVRGRVEHCQCLWRGPCSLLWDVVYVERWDHT